MEWNEEGRNSFELKTEKYLKAKLACVEIWGRLYNNKEDKVRTIDSIFREKKRRKSLTL